VEHPASGRSHLDRIPWGRQCQHLYQVDQTSLVTGGGTYTIRIASTSANGVDYSTRRGPPDLLLCSSSPSVPKGGDNPMTRHPRLDRHAPRMTAGDRSRWTSVQGPCAKDHDWPMLMPFDRQGSGLGFFGNELA
jgi:hypothetical protein